MFISFKLQHYFTIEVYICLTKAIMKVAKIGGGGKQAFFIMSSKHIAYR